MPKVGIQPVRREQLIRATLKTIDEVGLADATMAQIAGAAGMSVGIVSHYFGDKDGVLNAAMRQLLRDLKSAVARRRSTSDDSARAQLRAIVEGNFDESQTNPAAMRIWLTFWAASMHQPELARLQRANDRRLNSNLCAQFRRVLAPAEASAAARGLAALVDGLWLRGSLSSNFDFDQARALAFGYIGDRLDDRMDDRAGEAPAAPRPRRKSR